MHFRAGHLSTARAVAVVGLALLALWQVGRSALAAAYIADRPEVAARFWPSLPDVALANLFGDIGRSAAAGRAAPADADRRASDAARHAPLAAEPFLIAGALAQGRGDMGRAERLFVEARNRDPRAAGARYFLAQRYLSTGREQAGIAELATLLRLVPGGREAIVPTLAQLAQAPHGAAALRSLFVVQPDLAEPVLALLAADPAKADLVLTLAPTQDDNGQAPPWQQPLLAALVERGEVAKAEALWRRFNRIDSDEQGLFNPRFDNRRASPPFNWSLAAGDAGIAEPDRAGGLTIVYYGRAAADLARQLIVLAPGRYGLSFAATADGAGDDGGLEWSIRCVGASAPLATRPLAAQPAQMTFVVPARGCAGVWLALSGRPGATAVTSQGTVSTLRLDRLGT